MSRSNATWFQHKGRALRWRSAVFLAGIMCLSIGSPSPHGRAQSNANQGPVQRRINEGPAKTLLSEGMFYYRSDDVSNAAADRFKRVIRMGPDTSEAETAQYYLASYYHRKYYIEHEKDESHRTEILGTAEEHYKKYIARYAVRGTKEWLSDARFNLALVYLQLGNSQFAEKALKDLLLYDVSKDPSIYIYQVVWSTESRDVIDSNFDSRRLAEYTLQQLWLSSGTTPDLVISRLKTWCRSERGRQ